jgi:hypothetical protein
MKKLIISAFIVVLGSITAQAQYTWWHSEATPENWPHGERYGMDNVLHILDNRLTSPQYFNAYVDMVTTNAGFPTQQGNSEAAIQEFRMAMRQWVIDNPTEITALLTERNKAVGLYADPRPGVDYPVEPQQNLTK